MHFSTTINALFAGLLITSVSAADPARNFFPRATTDASACQSTLDALHSHAPTPTDKSLSSWLLANPATGTSISVPSSLQKAFCTYDHSVVNWAKSTVAPFASSCSVWLGSSAADTWSTLVQEASTTQSWCSSVTGNAAFARETGYLPGVMAAAGLVAAVL